jgi:hypothetical protein
MQTMSMEEDLKRGLTKEVEHTPEPFTDLKKGHGGALDVGRPSPAAEVTLEQHASQLHAAGRIKLQRKSPPTPKKLDGLPSDSPHLPRAGGDRRIRPARRRTLAQ